MYRTNITVNGKTIPVKFGAFVLKLLADNGLRLKDIPTSLQDNPADVMPKIIYYGAINASEGRKGENLDINDIYDWIDEVEGGLFGTEVGKVIELFTKQMTEGVPKNPEAPAGAKTTTKNQ